METQELPNGKTLYAYWVCVDCYFAHHGLGDDDPTYVPDREPLGIMPDNARVSDWTYDPDDVEHYTDEMGTGILEFSWASCDGCGSTLGGSRHRLASDR